MPNCSIRGCSNKSGHLYPKNNPALKRRWLKFAGLKEEDINSYSLICKDHFAEDAFDQHEPVPGLPPPRKRLKSNAVPTLFANLTATRVVSPRRKIVYTPAVMYNMPARGPKKIRLEEVDVTRGLVFSDQQLTRVIERIREKLVKNAHPSAVFPKTWQKPSLLKSTPKIREGFPPFSMPCLVALAIEANLKRMATSSQIVGFISQNFPCYKLNDSKWHGKVLETLEAYRPFQKVPACLTDCPGKSYYQFVPDKKTIMSPEVYEAFTDPFFNDSKTDPAHAVTRSSDHVSKIATKNIKKSRVSELDDDDDSGSSFSDPDNKAGNVDTDPDYVADEGSNSDEEAENSTKSDSSSDEESVTFLECRYCEFVASSAKTISTHVLRKHWNGHKYCCPKCSFVTMKTEELNAHKATHRK